jgi:peptide/nickel transport system ATP-binding protein
VAGESGSGKTTLARLLLGILTPTTGHVLYHGKDLKALSRPEWQQFRRDVQAIFQDPYEVYNPFYKVDHVLTTPVAKFRLAKSRGQTRQIVEEALHGVGLRPEETLGRYPHQLSGGQRQRVMVARALLVKPRVILADEPVSMVDASLRATILETLTKLHKELGISVLYITHDLTTAYQVSDYIIVLYKGSVAEAGNVDIVIKEPMHPYTRLLVASIPLANPEKRWSEKEFQASLVDRSDALTRGCKFADRCPFVMPMCGDNPPPLFQTDRDRAAACFLYKDAPVIVSGEMHKVFPVQSSEPSTSSQPNP